MNNIEARPDFFIEKQFRLAATDWPARSHYRGPIDIRELRVLTALELDPEFAQFSDILVPDYQPVAGLAVRVLASRTRLEDEPRADILAMLEVEIENTSDDEISFDTVVTLVGVAAREIAVASTRDAYSPLTNTPLELSVTTMGGAPIPAHFVEVAPAPLIVQSVNGTSNIVDLAVGAAPIAITVSHSGTRVFTTPLALRLIAVPAGVRVTPLLARSNGDKTDGGQFVLLVENISYATPGDAYGTSAPDIALSWERKGV